jgi:hypothetical protein
MGILKNVLGTPFSTVITTSISGDYTVSFNDTRIEVNASSGNVTITLPTITDQFKKRPEILIKRIDDDVLGLYNVIINGTSGNYEDDGIKLFGLEGTTIYAGQSTWYSVL